MSRLLLVRHAHAGDRGAWVGDDEVRPLSPRGRAQAEALVDVLGPLLTGAASIATSPARRCAETVAPLAAALALPVTTTPALAEGADVAALRARLAAVTAPTVWCSHGDVIPALLDRLSHEGVDLGPDPRCRKASTWVLELSAGDVRTARHLPPPEVPARPAPEPAPEPEA